MWEKYFKKNRGMVVDVSSFTPEDQLLLENMMRTKFLLDISFHRRSESNTKLYIKAASATQFCNLIRPFVIPSMDYKLTC